MKLSEACRLSDAFDAYLNCEIKQLLLFAETKEIAEIIDLHKPIALEPLIQEVQLTDYNCGFFVSHFYASNCNIHDYENKWGVIIIPEDIYYEENGETKVQYVKHIDPLTIKYVNKFLIWLGLDNIKPYIEVFDKTSFSHIVDKNDHGYKGIKPTLINANRNLDRLSKRFPIPRPCVVLFDTDLGDWRWKIENIEDF